jgi:hypothetical protein
MQYYIIISRVFKNWKVKPTLMSLFNDGNLRVRWGGGQKPRLRRKNCNLKKTENHRFPFLPEANAMARDVNIILSTSGCHP